MIANVNSKGLSIAGALLLSACNKSSESALHDTYYVVAHSSYLLTAAFALALMALSWAVIARFSARITRRFAAIMVGVYIALGALTLTPILSFTLTDPTLYTPERFTFANRISMIAGAISATLLLISVILAVALIIRALIRNR